MEMVRVTKMKRVLGQAGVGECSRCGRVGLVYYVVTRRNGVPVREKVCWDCLRLQDLTRKEERLKLYVFILEWMEHIILEPSLGYYADTIKPVSYTHLTLPTTPYV